MMLVNVVLTAEVVGLLACCYGGKFDRKLNAQLRKRVRLGVGCGNHRRTKTNCVTERVS